VAEWFVVTQREGAGITRAFVSERRGDDPKIVGRIVIIARPSKEPTHLVYSPAESAFWVVTVAPDWNEPQRFDWHSPVVTVAAPNWSHPSATSSWKVLPLTVGRMCPARTA
jgi:hypothetical protein